MDLEKEYLRGHQRAIVAHGIQDSGLLREMSSTRESIARLTAMADYSFDAIVRELSLNRQMMSGLLEAVQNPKETAANELYNRGVTALNNGWGPEAIRDLEESVTPANSPYNARAHFALGYAYKSEEKDFEAASSFSNAARYSLGETNYDPEMACGAALLGSLAFLEARQPDEAKQLLHEVHEKIPNCPEVALAIARRWSVNADVYRRALSAAPEFATEVFSHDLRRGSADTIEAVSEDLCFGRKGLSDQLERVRASHKQLTTDLKGLGETAPTSRSISTSQGIRGESPNAILLAGVGTAINEQVQQLATLVDTVDSKLQQWVSVQNSNLGPERSRLASEQSRLNQKGRQHQEAKEKRKAFGTWGSLWTLGAIILLALLGAAFLAPDQWILVVLIVIPFFALALGLFIGLFVVIFFAWNALTSIGTMPVSSRERQVLDQQKTEIENKEREVANKQREVEGHLEAARKVLASWPPTRVVPLF